MLTDSLRRSGLLRVSPLRLVPLRKLPLRSPRLRSKLYSSAPLSPVPLRNLLLRSECNSLVLLSPVAHSTVRRARYLRVCSRCILRTVSVVPSDRVILDRALNVRQRRDRALRQRVLRPRVLRRTALSSVRLRARLGTRLSAAPASRAKPRGTRSAKPAYRGLAIGEVSCGSHLYP